MRITGIGMVAAVVLTLLSVLAPAPAQAMDADPAWGSVGAQDGVLKKRCRTYEFDYAVTAPQTGEWDLSVTVVGPGREELWFGYLYEGPNPATGSSSFRLCAAKTRPGRFRLRAVVSNQHYNEVETVTLPTATFHLRQRG